MLSNKAIKMRSLVKEFVISLVDNKRIEGDFQTRLSRPRIELKYDLLFIDKKLVQNHIIVGAGLATN